jgi:hypothetical protein
MSLKKVMSVGFSPSASQTPTEKSEKALGAEKEEKGWQGIEVMHKDEANLADCS